MELAKTFDPKSAEERWYEIWVAAGYFTANPDKPGEAFSIVIPPPNVTGQLHLGHALNVTLQDLVVRTRRMQGYNTLWLPGTDHAGIATQNVVERELAKEKKDRHQIGRDAFEKRVWAWRDTYGNRILHQLRRLGASCDWSRERFTLDPGLSRAVNEVFVKLYQQGLIYRDRRLINWCPRCETALSDLEVDRKEIDGQLYYIRYPLADGAGTVTVATTRPETMLGDTAVAVHPDDERYGQYIGKSLQLPLTSRTIPVIADDAVDPKFGTGAVKVTPAHDFNDFEIGQRHRLPQISVMDDRARMNQAAGKFQGLSREEARRLIVDELKSTGLLEKIENHRMSIGVCSRCDSVVEPMLSTQWFVKVQPLAEKAIAAVKDGRTTFHPKFWENTYFSWMENIHDWCISRQLWWGHRIPAYRCERCDQLMVSAERPPKCENCGGTDLSQDQDVLDTWFSSGLWPFSTLGWPIITKDFERYYPTTLLSTGFDIIFFWVARMMMLGLWFTDDVPFRHVYIHPLVRDEQGRKMTKSRGNVVDPLAIMDTYGTDAVRFTLAQLAVQGRDLVLSNERLAASKAFANKVWNAGRFIMMNLADAPKPVKVVPSERMALAEGWILDRLSRATSEVTSAINEYEFNKAALAVYQFIWHEFCDWYIELSKQPLKAGGEQGDAARYALVHTFDHLLRLLHPFMPFLTEELWQALRPYVPEDKLPQHIAVAAFPSLEREQRLSDDERDAMNYCVEATEAINSLRSLLGVHPGQRVAAIIKPTVENFSRVKNGFEKWRLYSMTMAKGDRMELAEGSQKTSEGYVSTVLQWGEISVQAPTDFDFDRARTVLQKKLDEVDGHLNQQKSRLGNPEFQAKASSEMKEQIQQRADELESQRRMLKSQLEVLGASAG